MVLFSILFFVAVKVFFFGITVYFFFAYLFFDSFFFVGFNPFEKIAVGIPVLFTFTAIVFIRLFYLLWTPITNIIPSFWFTYNTPVYFWMFNSRVYIEFGGLFLKGFFLQLKITPQSLMPFGLTK